MKYTVNLAFVFLFLFFFLVWYASLFGDIEEHENLLHALYLQSEVRYFFLVFFCTQSHYLFCTVSHP